MVQHSETTAAHSVSNHLRSAVRHITCGLERSGSERAHAWDQAALALECAKEWQARGPFSPENAALVRVMVEEVELMIGELL